MQKIGGEKERINMSVSIFQVAGPVMIGPSSSHTAGAARLGRIAAKLADGFDFVSFGLHGSFAKTGKGHGTDKALLAGAMGIKEDDEAIARAFSLAEMKNVGYEFHETEIPDVPENSVRIIFYKNGNRLCEVDGSSLGGGQVMISRINGYDVELSGNLATLFIRQVDTCGVVSRITAILAEGGINIASMKVSRKNKREEATCVIETDEGVSEELLNEIRADDHIYEARAIYLS